MDWRSVNFDWNRARAFLVTAEEGSLSAAARALGLAQPTLGRQVTALERELGVALFERVGRGLALTPSATTTPCTTSAWHSRSSPTATAATTSRPRSGSTNTPTAHWPSFTDLAASPATGPTARRSNPQPGRPRDPLRRDRSQALQVDSRSAPDHFPTGPTATTEAVNSSGTYTGQFRMFSTGRRFIDAMMIWELTNSVDLICISAWIGGLSISTGTAPARFW